MGQNRETVSLLTDDEIDKIVQKVKVRAEGKRQNAGFAGEWGDGGASRDLDILAAWCAGLNRTVPRQFLGVLEDLRKDADPEYAEYLRLKSRFEK